MALLEVDGVPTRVRHRPEDTASNRPVRRGLVAAALAVTLCGLGVVLFRNAADEPDASAPADDDRGSDTGDPRTSGDRMDVAVDGTFRACSDIGSEWVLNALNATGTETATFTVRAP